AVNADSRPATTHVIVDVRRTHTPERRADSAFSAVARIASPQGDHRRKSASASATSGATMSVSTWPGVKRKPSSVKLRWIGTGKGSDSFLGRTKGRTVKR